MRHIERDEVVPKEKRRSFGEFVQPRERLGEIASLIRKRFPRIPAYGRELPDPMIIRADFQIDGQTARPKVLLLFLILTSWSVAFYEVPRAPGLRLAE